MAITPVQLLRQVALGTGFTGLVARHRSGVRMLMHHGVGDGYRAEALEQQILWLKASFTLLPFGEIAQRLRDGRPLPERGAVLTFDDGLRNNVAEAYPVLQKHQVPATFFVCPGLIESGQWIWTYEVRERLKSMPLGQLRELGVRCLDQPTTSIDSFVSLMKRQPNNQRLQTLSAVRSATPNFQVTEQHRREYDLASWAELASLDRRLITLGSHTMSHPILSSLTDEELDRELRESKEALVARGLASADETYFCYPDGNHNDKVLACARNHYAAACSTRKGFVTANSPILAMPRIGANSSLEDVAWRMWRPEA